MATNGKRFETANGRKSEGRESNSNRRGRTIDWIEGRNFLFQKENSTPVYRQLRDAFTDEIPFPLGGTRCVVKRKKTYVIFPNSAINNQLLSLSPSFVQSPSPFSSLLTPSPRAKQVRNKYLPKNLISMKDRSGRMILAAARDLPLFARSRFQRQQPGRGWCVSHGGRGDAASATRATLSLCLFDRASFEGRRLSRLGRRTRTRLVYIVHSETNEEQQRERERETRPRGLGE